MRTPLVLLALLTLSACDLFGKPDANYDVAYTVRGTNVTRVEYIRYSDADRHERTVPSPAIPFQLTFPISVSADGDGETDSLTLEVSAFVEQGGSVTATVDGLTTRSATAAQWAAGLQRVRVRAAVPAR